LLQSTLNVAFKQPLSLAQARNFSIYQVYTLRQLVEEMEQNQNLLNLMHRDDCDLLN